MSITGLRQFDRRVAQTPLWGSGLRSNKRADESVNEGCVVAASDRRTDVGLSLNASRDCFTLTLNCICAHYPIERD